MSDEHKAALAEGRAQGRAVRLYLEALEANKPKRGRKRTPDSIKKRLDTIAAELTTADPLKRLQLTQEQLDLEVRARRRRHHRRPHRPGEGLHRRGVGLRLAQGHQLRRLPQRGRPARRAAAPPASPGPPDARQAQAAAAARCSSDCSSGTPSVGAQQLADGPLRVGHEAHHVAPRIADPGDVVDRPVGVGRRSAAPPDRWPAARPASRANR